MKHPKINRQLRLSAPVGVHGILLFNGEVLGTFNEKLVEIGGRHEPRLIETFVNVPNDPKSIARFTRSYGPPLKIPVEPGNHFRFKLEEFRATQEQFRHMWRNLEDVDSSVELLKLFGGRLVFSKGITTYFAPNLYAYLYADLITNSSIERFRVCQREECSHPYFSAGHLRQQFCSDECADEGKRTLKREWWQRHRGSKPRAKNRTDMA